MNIIRARKDTERQREERKTLFFVDIRVRDDLYINISLRGPPIYFIFIIDNNEIIINVDNIYTHIREKGEI